MQGFPRGHQYPGGGGGGGGGAGPSEPIAFRWGQVFVVGSIEGASKISIYV